ncbi:saccharopine dehydrogenase C-terminal domain-containing protein [Pedobacter heparinus]|uniref:Saccharopine dehydrogenase n=1 Tax=Pedobacter heparinus (strain ATCC 13125 / DSM 2366 / CIP 104194 / JCM 7457 / NBRC 12017 / NCIMB 9290 / NRRL B-14731 / HIM 762-3) TaxID=485917 RepID=C6XZC8_PEDHD|nr:saccharopine dehydrogenase C-terminal domain-containing protein [Pedobacter heparinus]ACU04624.1 Saccharopine dehydrogenase [Pedobacter heparinus DSM 2366]
MIKKVLTLGLGKVGTLVGVLLSEQFEVTGMDKQQPHYPYTLPFKVITGDVTDAELMRKLIADHDAVVSALPYFLNKTIALIAQQTGSHYFDLTEDVETTAYIRELSKDATAVMAPQCGLAPGIIGVIGAHLSKDFEKIRSIEMRVGALPKYPNGQMAYSFTWSAAGVVNEYINDAEAIHNAERKRVISLQGKEAINIEGAAYEAFYTSGGLGTMCETYEGRVDKLDYKTIRYPGHCDLMNFLIHELHLKNDKQQLEELLKNAKPEVEEDVVLIYAVAEGWKDGQMKRNEFYKACAPIVIAGQRWRAISWTTAASLVAVIEMVANGSIPAKGFIKQEEISLESLLDTRTGSLFKS